MKSAVLILALALSGCSICRDHETACAAIAVVSASCIGLVAGSSNPSHPHNVPSICQGELSCR